MNRHRRMEAKRARRRKRVGQRSHTKHAEAIAAQMNQGAEKWHGFAGIKVPIHLGYPKALTKRPGR